MEVKEHPKEQEERFNALFDKLVPSRGNCKTIEGEMLRALGKMSYRFYNDGDLWFMGYGIETAGSAAAFLCSERCPIDLRQEFYDSESCEDEEYSEFIIEITEKVLNYIDSLNGQYKENKMNLDMLEFKSKYVLNESSLIEDGIEELRKNTDHLMPPVHQ